MVSVESQPARKNLPANLKKPLGRRCDQVRFDLNQKVQLESSLHPLNRKDLLKDQ